MGAWRVDRDGLAFFFTEDQRRLATLLARGRRGSPGVGGVDAELGSAVAVCSETSRPGGCEHFREDAHAGRISRRGNHRRAGGVEVP